MKLDLHEYIHILTKLLNGWVKIVDFLLIAYFWASVIFLLLSFYIHNFDISINHEMIFISLNLLHIINLRGHGMDFI